MALASPSSFLSKSNCPWNTLPTELKTKIIHIAYDHGHEVHAHTKKFFWRHQEESRRRQERKSFKESEFKHAVEKYLVDKNWYTIAMRDLYSTSTFAWDRTKGHKPWEYCNDMEMEMVYLNLESMNYGATHLEGWKSSQNLRELTLGFSTNTFMGTLKNISNDLWTSEDFHDLKFVNDLCEYPQDINVRLTTCLRNGIRGTQNFHANFQLLCKLVDERPKWWREETSDKPFTILLNEDLTPLMSSRAPLQENKMAFYNAADLPDFFYVMHDAQLRRRKLRATVKTRELRSRLLGGTSSAMTEDAGHLYEYKSEDDINTDKTNAMHAARGTPKQCISRTSQPATHPRTKTLEAEVQELESLFETLETLQWPRGTYRSVFLANIQEKRKLLG